MSISGFRFGIATSLVILLSMSPLFGWLNLVNIPVAMLGLILSIIGTAQGNQRFIGIAGIVICIGVIALGIVRLFYGESSTLP